MNPTILDLGYKDPYGSQTTASPEKSDEQNPKTLYPSLSIEQKPQLLEALEVGQEITATVRLKVTGLTDKKGGRYNSGDQCTVEFDVLSMSPKGISIVDDEEGESVADAMDKAFSKNKDEEPGE